jgi:hypothetical protein
VKTLTTTVRCLTAELTFFSLAAAPPRSFQEGLWRPWDTRGVG